MAGKKKKARSAGFVVIKDAHGNVYVAELGDPVTDSLTKSQKSDLIKQFDAYRKADKSANADAVLVNDAAGAGRMLERGHRPASSGDDGNKKKKS